MLIPEQINRYNSLLVADPNIVEKEHVLTIHIMINDEPLSGESNDEAGEITMDLYYNNSVKIIFHILNYFCKTDGHDLEIKHEMLNLKNT